MEDWEFELGKIGAVDSPPRTGRGRPTKAPISMEFVREMTEEDLVELAKPAEVRLPAVTKLRHSHHALARMVALGERGVAIEKFAGYNKQTIYNLCADPAFMELVAYYKDQIDLAYKDAAEEIADMGMTYWQELYRRFENDPEAFTNEELFKFGGDHVGRTILPEKGKAPVIGGSSNGPRVGVQIAFVSPPKQLKDATPEQIEVSIQQDNDDEQEDD